MAVATTKSIKRALYPFLPLGSNDGGTSYFPVDTFFFNSEETGTYTFKAEDILADRVPTIRRVIVTYIDFGPFTAAATITGNNDNGASVTTGAISFSGGTGMTGDRQLKTVFVDLEITCFRPQLTINRAANSGSLYISTILLTGTIERAVTL